MTKAGTRFILCWKIQTEITCPRTAAETSSYSGAHPFESHYQRRSDYIQRAYIWRSTSNDIVTTETADYSTDFQQSAVSETSGSFTAIKSIELPDGSSYSFTYDSGTGSGHYGELTSVTLPSGGVINYTWLNYKDSFQNENRWLQTRVKDGGTTTFQPQTISLCSGSSGCQEKTTVTDPAGNDTVYTFTLDPGTDANAGSWNTGIAAYQGPASGGAELKSVSTSFTYGTTYMTYPRETNTTPFLNLKQYLLRFLTLGSRQRQ